MAMTYLLRRYPYGIKITEGKPWWLSICEEERNQTTDLLEQITSLSNLQKAYQQVRRNGGSCGVDKMRIKILENGSDKITKNYKVRYYKATTNPKASEEFKFLNPKEDSVN